MSYPQELNGIDRQPRVWIKTKNKNKKQQKKQAKQRRGKKRSVGVPVPKTLKSNLTSRSPITYGRSDFSQIW